MLIILGVTLYMLGVVAAIGLDDRLDDDSPICGLYLVFRSLVWPLIPIVRLLESPVRLLGPGEDVP